MSYERENIRNMLGYTWGEQPQDESIIKLNTNENPYPPSPRVAQALASYDVTNLRRYPQPTADKLRKLIAQIHDISMDNIVITNGSDEFLRLAFTTFLEPGEPFGMTDPSYSLYSTLAEIHGSPVIRIPLTEDWDLPRDFAHRLNGEGVRLTNLVCPQTPSGKLIDLDTLSRIANELNGVLIVDEAYVDFVDPSLRHETINLIRAFDNLFLLRTLSKGYSLAGLRVGFAMGQADLISPVLTKTRDSYNVSTLSQELSIAALGDAANAEAVWDKVRAERRRLREQLRQRNFTVPASQANFLLAELPIDSKTSAKELYEGLKRLGILVRYFDVPGLDDKLRISIGDAKQIDRLLEAIDSLMK